MSKKIIFLYILLILNACNSKHQSVGQFNDLTIVTSSEDRDYIYPYLSKIIDKSINTPLEEKVFNVKWVDANNFFDYKYNNNIILISLDNPPDSTADILYDKFSEASDSKIFTISDPFSDDQLLLSINAFDSIELANTLNDYSPWIYTIFNNRVLKSLFDTNNKNEMHADICSLLKDDYNLDIKVDENYKIIRSDNDFIWIGRGYPYRWLMIHIVDNDTVNDDVYELYKAVISNKVKSVEIKDTFKSVEYETNYIKLSGMYEHEDSDTGGPFVSFCYKDTLANSFIFISGFVNNPGKSKYRLIKQLESIIINSKRTYNES